MHENENKDLDEHYGLTEEEKLALAEEDDAGLESEQSEEDPEEKGQEEPSASDDEVEIDEKLSGNPILVPPPVDGTQEKLDSIAEKKNELYEQFDNGDLTTKEYQKQLDALFREERAIEFQIHEAQMAAKLEDQRLKNEWKAMCDNFLDDNPIYKESPRLYKALDTEIKDLAKDPKTVTWTGQKFLQEAHKALQNEFKFAGSKETKSQSKTLPPNLSKIPAAEIENTDGGRFAVLDRLASTNPIEYENTLSKMSDSERNAYLAS